MYYVRFADLHGVVGLFRANVFSYGVSRVYLSALIVAALHTYSGVESIELFLYGRAPGKQVRVAPNTFALLDRSVPERATAMERSCSSSDDRTRRGHTPSVIYMNKYIEVKRNTPKCNIMRKYL